MLITHLGHLQLPSKCPPSSWSSGLTRLTLQHNWYEAGRDTGIQDWWHTSFRKTSMGLEWHRANMSPPPAPHFFMPFDSLSKRETNNVGPHKQAICHSRCCDYVTAKHGSLTTVQLAPFGATRKHRINNLRKAIRNKWKHISFLIAFACWRSFFT